MDCLRYDACVGAVAEIDGVGVDTAGVAYRDHDLPVAYESDMSGKALQTWQLVGKSDFEWAG